MALAADLILRFRWIDLYYTFGVPLYVVRFPVRHKGMPHLYLLEEEFGPYSISFQKINDQVIGFHEVLFQKYPYIPLLHGVIIFEEKKLTIKGVANWTTLWLILYSILFVVKLVSPLINTMQAIVMGFAIVLFYSLQCSRFFQIGKFASKLLLEKQHVNSQKR